MDCGINNDCTQVNERQNASHVPTTQDAGLLQSAEYIKFVAAFFNLEPKANALFAATRAAVAKAAVSLVQKPPGRGLGGLQPSERMVRRELRSLPGGVQDGDGVGGRGRQL